MSSLRERVLNAKKSIRSEIVSFADIPDDNGNPSSVKIVGLSAGERISIIKRSTVTTNTDNGSTSEVDNGLLYPLLIATASRDPQTDAPFLTEGDSESLMSLSAGVIEEWAQEVLRVSGMGKESKKVMEKNSAQTPSDTTASS